MDTALGQPPTEPVRRAAWMREVATVVAHRERQGVTSRDPIATDRSSVEKIGREKRAPTAAERAARLASNSGHSPDDCTTGGDGSVWMPIPSSSAAICSVAGDGGRGVGGRLSMNTCWVSLGIGIMACTYLSGGLAKPSRGSV